MSKLQEIVKDREAWHAAVARVAKMQTEFRDGRTTTSHSWRDKGVHAQEVLQ